MADPKLRFKGFLDSWKSSMLGDLSSKVHDKNYNLVYKTTFTNSAEFGIIDQLDFFDHNISKNSNISNYTIVKDDYFVYNPRISVTAPVGPINRNKLGYTGVMSPLYYVFNVRGIDKTFLEYYFKTTVWHKYLKDNGNSGARHDRLSITDDLFSQMPILHPSLTKEQLKIADFFQNLDNQIKIQFKTLDRLKRIKLILMVAMFPQKGEATPRVRFKGFDGPWTVDSIGNLFDERTERSSNGEMLSVTMRNGVIKASENGKVDNSSEDKSHYKVVKVNDIPYNTMRMWQGACGCSDYDGIVSPAYTVLIPKDGVNASFFTVIFKTQNMLNAFKAHSQGLTSDNWNLKYAIISTIPIKHPSSLTEQQKIAELFQNLDRQIECQTQILERLKRVKAACLDQMFV